MPRKNYKRRKVAPLSKRQYAAVARVANKQLYKNAELKVYDGVNSSFTIRTTANVQKINPPPQGDGSSDRDGDQIYIKSFALNATVSPDSSQNMQARILLVQWLENDSTAPVVGDVLAQTGSAQQMLNSFYVTNPQKQFKVLDDRLFFWDTNNTSTDRPYRVRVKAKDLAIRKPDFDAAAITGRGNLYFILIGDSATDGTLRTPVARLRYYDM